MVTICLSLRSNMFHMVWMNMVHYGVTFRVTQFLKKVNIYTFIIYRKLLHRTIIVINIVQVRLSQYFLSGTVRIFARDGSDIFGILWYVFQLQVITKLMVQLHNYLGSSLEDRFIDIWLLTISLYPLVMALG